MRNTLASNIDAWRQIGASETVLRYISNGVKFPIVDIPSFCCENKQFSSLQSKFLLKEINDLLWLGHVVPCGVKPRCVSPINCIPKKNGKYRLVTDLRLLNNKCQPPKFKNEDISTVISFIQPKDYIVTADLKDGFFHVPVHPDHQELLGFQFRGNYYKWTVLPFGHSCSPYFFTKVLRPVIAYLRAQGLRVVVYVDDFILLAEEKCINSHRQLLLKTLQDLGWVVNFEKSSLVESYVKPYLGYIIDTSGEQCVIRITSERIRKLKRDIKKVLFKGEIQARGLARIAGQCVSMSKCIFPAKLLLRNLYRLLATRKSWSDSLLLDKYTRTDLHWWLDSVSQWNALFVVNKQIDTQLITDASKSGWGAWLTDSHKEAQGFWTLRIQQQSSNYRELLAVLMGLQSFKDDLRNRSIQVLSDNVTTVAMINGMGGSVASLDTIARSIHIVAMEENIKLQAKYLSGTKNWRADLLSRIESSYEWKLHPKLFQMLDRKWGPHDVDRFASITSTQLPTYNSMFYDPFTSGVDALAQKNWSQMNNYVNAPFALLPRVLNVINLQNASATVIAPLWPGQPWFRQLTQMAVDLPVELPMSKRTVMAIGAREPLKNPRWKIFAWRVCGRTDYVA